LLDGPISVTRDGLRVMIRLSPRAKADRLLAVAGTAEGGHTIKASVTAPPEGGRANEALLQLLARAWRLPRRDLTIVAGTASRNKTVGITGDPRRLLARLAGEIASLPGS
jgi:uncharacterized protein (TIGR00251 family)